MITAELEQTAQRLSQMTEMRTEPMRIELLSVTECPHVDATRNLLHSCLQELRLEVAVDEQVGAFPSPTILIDGVDVMKNPGISGAMCRLDLPTHDRLVEALREAAMS